MKSLKKIALISALTLSSISVQAELISTDWLVDGDAKATLNTETGIEWLKLDNTDGKSIADIQSELDTTYQGWRLPNEAEVLTYMNTAFYQLGELSDYENKSELGFTQYSSMVSSIKNTVGMTDYRTIYQGGGTRPQHKSYGMYLDQEGNVLLSGAEANMSGYTGQTKIIVKTGNGAGNDTTNASIYYGVFLVSDGGTTLSSINDPSLNLANPNAPVNGGGASVPLPATL